MNILKTKSTTWIARLLFCTVLFQFNGCNEEEPQLFKKDLSGHAEKGPYTIGSSVLISELNASLEQTGKTFTTQINDNSGSFDFGEIALQSKFVEFNANGYYFDEVKGELSAGPLNLYALADISDASTVNVNILTHLERPRVQFLVKNNNTFEEAKKIAQSEILALFGLNATELASSETLDISGEGEGNGILLALSIILQHDLSVAQLTEQLAAISNDLKEDGTVDASVIANLRTASLTLDLEEIRLNLIDRYSEIGSSITVPSFEQYVNKFLEYSGVKPVSQTSAATALSTTSAKLNGVVNPGSLNTTVSFEYGKTTSYTNSTTPEQVKANNEIPVGATISNLEPGTLYHYRLKTENSKGITYGADRTFTTLGKAPTSVTSPADAISTASANLNGVVNPGSLTTTISFEYGKTVAYENTTTTSQVEGNNAIAVAKTILNLDPGTIYHYRLKSENSKGVAYGSDLTFVTLGGVPIISNVSVSNKVVNEGTFSCEVNYSINAAHFPTSVSLDWGTTTSYGNTVTQSSVITGSSAQSISTPLSDLTSGVTYHYRIRAINQLGEVTFIGTLQVPAPVIDIDGNLYDVVTIGNQNWIAKNLRVTKLNDGTPIPLVEDGETWGTLTSSGYSWYNNDPSDKNPYGALYNWYTVNTQKLCPVGWHVPSTTEWQTLINYLGDGYSAATKLQNSTTGFGLLRGGFRFGSPPIGDFSYRNSLGYWWATTHSSGDPEKRMVFGVESFLVTANIHYYPDWGLSVRCLKD